MAKKKIKKSTAKNDNDPKVTSLSQSSKATESRVGDSYISLALGIIVVVAIAAVVVAFIKGNEYSVNTVIPQEDIEVATKEVRKYTLQEGEGIWDVAVKFYGDGFQWVKIVEVNKLENPDLIAPGTVLIIPEIE